MKPDEWFTEEVIAVSNHIVIRVNGKTAIDFVDKKNRQTRGHLAIQHLNPATVIQVRKAECKEAAGYGRQVKAGQEESRESGAESGALAHRPRD